ncbi:hypothetical protein J6590_030046 [Homalodisca vitripennis]|nr:hypothetical protein J6590_030046 [Homalodisca vitripennis]
MSFGGHVSRCHCGGVLGLTICRHSRHGSSLEDCPRPCTSWNGDVDVTLDQRTVQYTTHYIVQKHKVEEPPSKREGLQVKHVFHFSHWNIQKSIAKLCSKETHKTYLDTVQQLILAN